MASIDSPLTAAAMQQRVAAEQIRLVYRQLPLAIGPPLMIAPLVAFVLREQLPHLQLWIWTTSVVVAYLFLTSGVFLAYRRSNQPEANPVFWGRLFVVMALLTASSWGTAGFLLFIPDSLFHQIFLTSLLFASGAAVMAATFSYTPGFYAALIPILAPLAVQFVIAGGLLDYALAGLVTLSFVMLAYFQRGMHQSFAESLVLRFDRERLIAELETKNREVEHASRAKSRFLAATSHDLRQPMHAQRLFLGELEAGSSDPKSLAVISNIRQSMESMEKLLSELQDLSRLDVGAVDIKFRAIELKHMLSRLENEFSGMAHQKGLRLYVSPCQYSVFSDPALLERLLRNLVHNALRYTISGSVLIACRKRDAMIEIQVRDSGPGIAVAEQSLIFEEFSQLGNPERNREQGMGLGLAIVARLAQQLGHEFGVRSRPGSGSTFWVRARTAAASPQAAEQGTAPVHNFDLLAGMRVVVVDDDPDILAAMSLLLKRWGCQSSIFPDAAGALHHLEETGAVPDVVIADYRLPGTVDGIALITRIRDRLATPVKAILITGDTDPKVLRESRANNCIMLHKPVDAPSLYNLLCNLGNQGSASDRGANPR